MRSARLRTAARGGLLLLVVAACEAGRAETVHVYAVIDGDTLVVSDASGDRRTVRLIGVDTPELRHPSRPVEYLAGEARAFVAERVLDRAVRLEADPDGDDRDRFGRLLRYVHGPGEELLNAALVRHGFGYVPTRYRFSRSERFRQLEQRAREQGLGLWAEEGLAEVRWIDGHGPGAIGVYPTTRREWAITYEGLVKTRVPAHRLVRQLERLLAWLAEHDEEELRRELESNGYVRLRAESRSSLPCLVPKGRLELPPACAD